MTIKSRTFLSPKDCETDVIADEYLYTVILKMYSPTRIPRNRIFEGMCAFVVYIEYELFISLNIIFFK